MTAAGSSSANGRWLFGASSRNGTVPLFCFHHAGTGAAAYSRWRDLFLPTFGLRPVQLPGRENRIAEAPFRHIGHLLAALIPEFAKELRPPFAFLGHSMGALVAFELTRELRRANKPLPFALVLSALGAPHLADSAPRSKLGNEGLIAELASYGGVPGELLLDKELLELLLPILRVDLELCESYLFRPEPPLPVCILAVGGSGDERVPPPALEAWRCHTSRRFEMICEQGGHFFLHDERARLLPRIRTWLASELAVTRVTA